MTLIKRKLQAALLVAVLAVPFAALAEDAPAAAPAPEASAPSADTSQSDRMQLMQTMRSRMHEIMRTEDQAKRDELMAAQAKDMDAMMKMGPPAMGMGMGMGTGMGMGPGAGMMGPDGKPDCKMGHRPGMGAGMAMGPGMGMMMGPDGKKPCHMRHGDNCDRRDDAVTDQRLDSLEKRMDMMQMMLRMMLHE